MRFAFPSRVLPRVNKPIDGISFRKFNDSIRQTLTPRRRRGEDFFCFSSTSVFRAFLRYTISNGTKSGINTSKCVCFRSRQNSVLERKLKDLLRVDSTAVSFVNTDISWWWSNVKKLAYQIHVFSANRRFWGKSLVILFYVASTVKELLTSSPKATTSCINRRTLMATAYVYK